ncbi:UDP-N-acetylmuramoyl-tripeptide--D-alanyl-D-alanine ligase [bacterium]|nr:UDP-N-acetylmuramoyl-tripeptide--D-alanyl-D-alanine ligase [bacterium]
MENILANEVLIWTGSKLISGSINSVVSNFSTDSRTIAEDDFFIPIRGENYDGHDFITHAIKTGAKGFVYDPDYKDKNSLISFIKSNYPSTLIIESYNTTEFLENAAKGYLRKYKVTSIGITGSAGKTSTKNFLVNILKKSSNTVFSQKNFNNEIGIPKTIFEVNKNTRYFIAELGMRAKGQIAKLSEICNLNYGIITSIGPSHLEFFKNIDEIALAKAEIGEKINENNGILFLNGDDIYTDLIEKNVKCRILKCGSGNTFKYNFSNCINDKFAVYSFDLNQYDKKVMSVNLSIPGYHNIYNALLAAGVALYLNIDTEKIRDAIEETTPETLRMEIIEKEDKLILNDCYNANPLSLKSAIDSLSVISKDQKRRSVAVIGDMFELGRNSKKMHEEIGQYLIYKEIDVLVTIGEKSISICNKFAHSVKSCGEMYHFKKKEHLLSEIGKIIKSGDVILIKGSRANKMENIIDYI